MKTQARSLLDFTWSALTTGAGWDTAGGKPWLLQVQCRRCRAAGDALLENTKSKSNIYKNSLNSFPCLQFTVLCWAGIKPNAFFQSSFNTIFHCSHEKQFIPISRELHKLHPLHWSCASLEHAATSFPSLFLFFPGNLWEPLASQQVKADRAQESWHNPLLKQVTITMASRKGHQNWQCTYSWSDSGKGWELMHSEPGSSDEMHS